MKNEIDNEIGTPYMFISIILFLFGVLSFVAIFLRVLIVNNVIRSNTVEGQQYLLQNMPSYLFLVMVGVLSFGLEIIMMKLLQIQNNQQVLMDELREIAGK
ncbi:TPA: hypothetical protein DF272_03725 [Candidatus Falkowbacteria bacterium]|nr:hypothetical protein [Candidatus Falkowbacteria bacterium]